MGKAKKLKHLSKVRNVVSLDEQILTDATAKVTGRVKQRREKQPDEVAVSYFSVDLMNFLVVC